MPRLEILHSDGEDNPYDIICSENLTGVRDPALLRGMVKQLEVKRNLTGIPYGFFLCIMDDGNIGGVCALNDPIEGLGDCNLGYTTRIPYRGQGVATWMARSIIDMCASEDKAFTIGVSIKRTNLASIAVMERAGYQRHGLAVANIQGICLVVETFSADAGMGMSPPHIAEHEQEMEMLHPR